MAIPSFLFFQGVEEAHTQEPQPRRIPTSEPVGADVALAKSAVSADPPAAATVAAGPDGVEAFTQHVLRLKNSLERAIKNQVAQGRKANKEGTSSTIIF